MKCLSRTNGITLGLGVSSFLVVYEIFQTENGSLLPVLFVLQCVLIKMHKQANIDTGEKPHIHVEEKAHLILLFLAMCAYRNSQSGLANKAAVVCRCK